MHFYSGFSWAVPTAFCDPLGVCRFEEGDSLYDTKDAYLQWSEALKTLKYGIQVKLPRSMVGGTLKDQDDDVFSRNWRDSVTFVLTHYKENRHEEITTTQGRLYWFLKTGDFALFSENSRPLDLPILVSEANRLLEQIDQSAFHELHEGMNKPHIFIMAADSTSAVSRSKLLAIRGCWDGRNVKEKEFTPYELGLCNADRFAPTVTYVVFATNSATTEELQDCLKRVLYKPAKDRQTEKDRFLLRKHGLLVQPVKKLAEFPATLL